ncbi:unnamed protein product [Staurois parvus]|uniref:NADH dehydrogenase subunit 1 n=1 Tax=Staurois parvus TaxID=386267 RepID=A0ABN9HH31_9NEOB|nr:unnamed protein product [Staurois parvus]
MLCGCIPLFYCLSGLGANYYGMYVFMCISLVGWCLQQPSLLMGLCWCEV